MKDCKESLEKWMAGKCLICRAPYQEGHKGTSVNPRTHYGATMIFYPLCRECMRLEFPEELIDRLLWNLRGEDVEGLFYCDVTMEQLKALPYMSSTADLYQYAREDKEVRPPEPDEETPPSFDGTAKGARYRAK